MALSIIIACRDQDILHERRKPLLSGSIYGRNSFPAEIRNGHAVINLLHRKKVNIKTGFFSLLIFQYDDPGFAGRFSCFQVEP